MSQLHETLMGRKLIEHTLPDLARQLERIADTLEKKNAELIRLRERYKTLSELDADPKSRHKLSLRVNTEMEKTLDKMKNL